MSIRMVACDLDGTLLNSRGRVDAACRECLLNIQKHGIILVLASGRNRESIRAVEEELRMQEFPQDYVIGLNGQEITRLRDQAVTRDALLGGADISFLLELASRCDLEAVCFTPDGIFDYVPPRYKLYKTLYALFTGRRFVQDVEARMKTTELRRGELPPLREANKIAYIQSAEKLDRVTPKLRRRVGGRYQVMRVKPKWMEVVPNGVSKGKALLQIAREAGVAPDEILAFGDGENDISMLSSVKYGVAMGNAADSVKRAAFETCDTNDNLGIVRTIRKYIAG